MKKIFISILSVAMFAACAKSETEEIAPIAPEPEDEAQTVYVEIGVMTGSETKATYDADLHAYWEAGDQIRVIQGSASSDTTTFPNNAFNGKTVTYTSNEFLSLTNGANSQYAVFSGDIKVNDSKNERYFHFAYPFDNSTLSTKTIVPYTTSSGTYSTTTDCTYTVPTEQDGKWTPFLCASTTEQTTAENITGIDFGTSLNACFAVRVFDNDKTTPKKIKSITIAAESDIVGTMSATTANDGAFSADMFTCNGGGNTITADNLQNIETLGGLYEYRFEVLPVEAGVLTLTIADEAGSVITRKTSSKTFKANTRGGTNVYWDEAIITMDKPLSWFEDTTGDHLSTLAPKSIYAQNVNISGVGIDGITEVGIYVNGEKKPNDDKALQFDKQVAVPESGEYIVEPYAILANGTEIKGAGQTVIVTDKLEFLYYNIRSSYTENGETNKNKELDGDKIYAVASINDQAKYVIDNLVDSARLYYDNDGANTYIDIDAQGTQFKTSSLTYEIHTNCYAEVVFKNGYTITTPVYSTIVTGVPYSITTDSATPTGWNTSNTSTSSGKLLIKDGGYAISPAFYASTECSYSVTVSAQVYCYRGSLTSATYTLSMQTDPAGNASLSENLSGGTNTGDSSSTKTIYPDFYTSTKIRIGSTKVKTGGLSAIPYGIRVHSLSVQYN